MVFNATFNNISLISWQSVLLVVETKSTRRKPPTCQKSLTSFTHNGVSSTPRLSGINFNWFPLISNVFSDFCALFAKSGVVSLTFF